MEKKTRDWGSKFYGTIRSRIRKTENILDPANPDLLLLAYFLPLSPPNIRHVDGFVKACMATNSGGRKLSSGDNDDADDDDDDLDERRPRPKSTWKVVRTNGKKNKANIDLNCLVLLAKIEG